MSKLTIRTIPFVLLLLLVTSAKQVNAQGASVYFGVGSAWDSAGTTNNPSCPSGQLYDDFTTACEPGPTMGGVFGVFGGDFMLKSHLGFNAEDSFRFSQAPFLPAAGLNMRPSFLDFNGVYEPISGSDSRVVPVVEAGVGDARVALYVNQNECISSICHNFSYPAGLNANHFQVHVAVGVKLYVKGNIFIKPQVDLHYAPNLTDQFGHDYVPEATVSVGYTFGSR